MARQSREGDVLAGKYRLERLLGRGAVGLIYQAQNTLIGRTVAIKLLRPELVSDEEVVHRFMREARAANLVRHPNVVDVLDIGQDESGTPFIVEEFLQGQDLARFVHAKGGRLTPDAAVELMIPVAEAAGFAHARGVVHRDLKPENVFLARIEGGKVVPKLLDFGLSRVKLGPGEIRATTSGMTMGSPAYMSPEQIEGAKDLDARADVWALGVILFEILAGQLPFSGDSHVAVFVQIAWADPPNLLDLAPGASRDLARVVNRCLRRKPVDRYPSAAELARDLRLVRDGGEIEPTLRHSIPVPPGAPGTPVVSLGRAFAQTEVSESLVKPAAARPAAKSGNPTEHHLLEFSDVDRGQSAAGSGLAIATLRPPPMPRDARADGESDASGELDLGVFWRVLALTAAAAITGAVLMLLLHRPGGWPLTAWAPGWFDGGSLLHSLLTATASAAATAWAMVHVVRTRAWLLLPTACGAALVTLSIVARLAGAGAVLGAAGWTPWALALIPFGLCVHAFRKSWFAWRVNDAWTALLLAVAGTFALFIAGELLRAAW